MRAKTAWVGAEGWVAAFRVSGSHRLIYGGEIHLKEEGAQAVGCHDPHVRCPLFMPTIKTISMIIESWKWSTDLSKQGALRMEKGSRRGKKKKKKKGLCSLRYWPPEEQTPRLLKTSLPQASWCEYIRKASAQFVPLKKLQERYQHQLKMKRLGLSKLF